MTQVWVVQYDEGLYLFKDTKTAEISISQMYDPTHTFETQEVSDVAYTVTVMNSAGKIQDRINIIAFDVHESPTVIHRYVTEIDAPPVNVDPRFVKGDEF